MSVSLESLVSLYGDSDTQKELVELRGAATEAHIAWSVATGYYEQVGAPSAFFTGLRGVFRKHVKDTAKVAQVRTAHLESSFNARDDVTEALLQALAADPSAKDAAIQRALDTLASVPLPVARLK